MVEVKKECIVDINRFSDYDKLINVTAKVLKATSNRSILMLKEEPEAEDLQEAEIFWIKIVPQDITEGWRVRYQRLGPIMKEKGTITVDIRVSNWLKINWNRN